MKRILILFLTLLAFLSARGQTGAGQSEGLSMNRYYLGAEADVGEVMAACIVGGAYFSEVNVELRLRYPFGEKEIAYYNLPVRYGRSREIEMHSGYGLEAFAGYGMPLSGRFRLTPSAGLRYTPIKGWGTDWSLMEQRSYVFSGVAALKAEYSLSPSISLVATPAYAVPLGRDAFVRSFETVCPAIKSCYGGLSVHIGIHFNF